MNTHLSEESVNALLTLVKGAKTSRSYDDKINILEKAGVLHGGQKYSNRGPAAPMPQEAGAAAPAAIAPAPEPVAGIGYWLDGQVEARIKQDLAKLKNLETLIKEEKARSDDFYPNRWYDFIVGKRTEPASKFELWYQNIRNMAAAKDQGVSPTETGYQDVLEQIADAGFAAQLSRLAAYTKSANPDSAILAEIALVFALFFELLGITAETLIMEGPNYLSTIPDGNYSFSVYPQSTTQPGILTGTAVVSSQKDIYPGIVVQKLINSKIAGTPPITALQTLDASYTSRQIDTSGSSYNGKYTVTGNTATITSNGYSKEAGEFVETVTTITTYPAGFFVNNSIINLDKSYTPISLVFYIRQLTSAEVDKLSAKLISLGDTNLDKKVSRAEVVALTNAWTEQLFTVADLNQDDFIELKEASASLNQVGSYLIGVAEAWEAEGGAQPIINAIDSLQPKK